MGFKDRQDAGRQLASMLTAYKAAQPVIVALPRGGVPVASEVAAALNAPLDIILVRKIGVPQQPELAAGAVVDGQHPVIVRNEDVIRSAGLSEELFQGIVLAELSEIRRRREVYLRSRPPLDFAGRTVIVVDDGVATGATARAALQAIRKSKPKRLVLAVSVCATDAKSALRRLADDVVCVEEPDFLGAVGSYYAHFPQITDAEVIKTLDDAA